MSTPTETGKEVENAPSTGIAATQGIVTIRVGAEQIDYQVHKSILIHHSEYFRRALRGPWKEAQENLVVIEDIEPNTFTLFVHWLYHKDLPSETSWWHSILPELQEEDENDCKGSILFHCIKAYEFGIRFATPSFARKANNIFAKKFATWNFGNAFGRGAISYAFDHLPADSIILENMVDDCTRGFHCGREDYGSSALGELPIAFVRRVLILFQEWGSMTDEEIKVDERCYLEHENEVEKTECGVKHMWYCAERDRAYFE